MAQSPRRGAPLVSNSVDGEISVMLDCISRLTLFTIGLRCQGRLASIAPMGSDYELVETFHLPFSGSRLELEVGNSVVPTPATSPVRSSISKFQF